MWTNQFVVLLSLQATRNHTQCHSQPHVLKANMQLWVERHTINCTPKRMRPLLVIRLRWARVWRFLNTGGWWWWCRRGGWCRSLSQYLQCNPNCLSNVGKLAMNIGKVPWSHTLTQNPFWNWLYNSLDSPKADGQPPTKVLYLAVTDLTLLSSWCTLQAEKQKALSCILMLAAGKRDHENSLLAVSNAFMHRVLDQSIIWFDNSKQECRNGDADSNIL